MEKEDLRLKRLKDIEIMRIRGKIDKFSLEVVRSMIGEQNYKAGKKLLSIRGQMWFFNSRQDVRENKDITAGEKGVCLRQFDDGQEWAGVVRTDRYIPGFTFIPPQEGKWSH